MVMNLCMQKLAADAGNSIVVLELVWDVQQTPLLKQVIESSVNLACQAACGLDVPRLLRLAAISARYDPPMSHRIARAVAEAALNKGLGSFTAKMKEHLLSMCGLTSNQVRLLQQALMELCAQQDSNAVPASWRPPREADSAAQAASEDEDEMLQQANVIPAHDRADVTVEPAMSRMNTANPEDTIGVPTGLPFELQPMYSGPLPGVGEDFVDTETLLDRSKMHVAEVDGISPEAGDSGHSRQMDESASSDALLAGAYIGPDPFLEPLGEDVPRPVEDGVPLPSAGMLQGLQKSNKGVGDTGTMQDMAYVVKNTFIEFAEETSLEEAMEQRRLKAGKFHSVTVTRSSKSKLGALQRQ
mmetsp:Transcript_40252/g.72881  ORF Transcript_40252/g.72881 Transcript_40252/m.72881 type:complete len:357 (+) Transcript_40252:74-1144(+)